MILIVELNCFIIYLLVVNVRANHLPVSSLVHSLQLLLEIAGDGAEEVQARVAALNEVVAVGVHLLTEEFAGLHISLLHFGKVAEMHVVVGRAMDEEQVATEVGRTLDGVGGIA